MPLRVLLVASLPLLFACGKGIEGGSAPLTGPLLAGAGSAVLDLPVGHAHAGYVQSRILGAPHPPGDPGSPFAEILPATRSLQSAPRAKALVLARGSRRIVLAQIDAVFVTSTLTERVATLARERLGTEIGADLLLHASHTHGAPGRFSFRSMRSGLLAGEAPPAREAFAHALDTFSAETTDRIAVGVVEAIRMAQARLTPARFGWATALVPDANRDRRCHDDWIGGRGDRDTLLTVLRVDAEAGDPIAILFHYALHGTLYDWNSRSLSVDAPGHVEYAVERRFDRPVVAIFLQGAAASASPDADDVGHDGSQAMERVAWELADPILAAWEAAEMREAIDLRFAIRRVPLSRQELGYAPGEFPEDGAMLCSLLDPGCVGAPRDPASIDCLGKAEPGGGKYETWIGALQLGDLAVVALPGEPSAAIGRAIRRGAIEAGFDHGIALGYSLDHDGYLLLEDDWLSGGSETDVGFWGWRLGPHLLERGLELLRALPRARSQPLRTDHRPDWESPAIAPSASLPGPALLDRTTVPRMREIRFSFHGGDPALGTPEVVLQRLEGDAFADRLVNGWIPTSNLRGPELPTFYEAIPTWREDPQAAARAHRWEVVFEPPRDLEAGRYRFVARGRRLVDGAIEPFAIESDPFEVVPSEEMRVEGRIVGTRLFVTLLYPIRPTVWSEEPADAGWQIGGFRPVDVRHPPDFVPAHEGEALLPAEAGEARVELRFEMRPFAPGERYAPGEGPGFVAELPPGTDAVTLPAGALADRHGNRTGAAVTIVR